VSAAALDELLDERPNVGELRARLLQRDVLHERKPTAPLAVSYQDARVSRASVCAASLERLLSSLRS
jgi:hypothetical protein